MTSDEFNSEYRLLKQVAGKPGRSYTAEHRASGRAVLVHMVEEGQFGGEADLHALLERLPPREKAKVLGTMKVDRSLVVVTQFLPGFEGFEGWLRARTSASSIIPPTQAGLPLEGQGEFTRLFRSSEESPAKPVDRVPASEDRLPAVPPPAATGFTDLFRAPMGPSHQPQGEESTAKPLDRAPASEDRMPAVPPPAATGFTDLFRAPTGPPHQPQGADRATIPPVRIVGVRVPSPVEPVSPEPEPPRLKPNFGPSTDQPLKPNFGPSTDQPLKPNFGPSTDQPLKPNFGPSTDRPAQPDLRAGLPQMGEVIIRGPEPAAELPPPQFRLGPSEFTRQLGAVPSPTGELAQAEDEAKPPEESTPEKRSLVPLFLVLNLVFVLATGLVVYFALRRC